MKTVYKPWGKEVWLELNNFYCYKRIYINAGHKTSFQYHNEKHETNYIISGTAEVWLEDDTGVIHKKIMKEGDYFNVTPPKKHRVIAITDLILQEVSTPHVDDVIRIEDDTNRPDGKIVSEHEVPAVLILCAGLGTRLQPISKSINKVLLPINNKAVISHIIDAFPDEYEIILAVGYKGDVVKEYCSIAHSTRNIKFVDVEDFTSEKSGPGYSALQCKHLLQKPFYFITGDCLLENPVPSLKENWIGTTPTEFPEKYSTALVQNGIVTDFKNKSKEGFDSAFIGVAGIVEYQTFWQELEQNINNSGEIVSAFLNINRYTIVKSHTLSWFDTGNLDDLLKAKKYFGDKPLSLNKEVGEITYKVNNKFLKYFADQSKLQKLRTRHDKLKDITPQDMNFGEHFLSYKWIDGNTIYYYDDIEIMKKFLIHLENQFTVNTVTSPAHISKFYVEKTNSRVQLFIQKFGEKYYNNIYEINGKLYPSMKNIIENINFSLLDMNPLYEKFHGDLQFENILYAKDKFYYIDWREDFGGNLNVGDVYYDLSKLMGGTIIPYNNMKYEDNITLVEAENKIRYIYHVSDVLKSFSEIYNMWLQSNKFDISKIKLITGLIFLNMSPLHDEKFSKLLWFKSMELLSEYYNKH